MFRDAAYAIACTPQKRIYAALCGGGFRQLQMVASTTFRKNSINLDFVPRNNSFKWVTKKNIEILRTFFETEVGNLFTRLFRCNCNYNPGKKVENKS